MFPGKTVGRICVSATLLVTLHELHYRGSARSNRARTIFGSLLVYSVPGIITLDLYITSRISFSSCRFYPRSIDITVEPPQSGYTNGLRFVYNAVQYNTVL